MSCFRNALGAAALCTVNASVKRPIGRKSIRLSALQLILATKQKGTFRNTADEYSNSILYILL